MLLTLTFFNFEEYPKTTCLYVMLSCKQLHFLYKKVLCKHSLVNIFKMSFSI